MTLATGDTLDGTFYGSFGEGIKVTGTFRRRSAAAAAAARDITPTRQRDTDAKMPKYVRFNVGKCYHSVLNCFVAFVLVCCG